MALAWNNKIQHKWYAMQNCGKEGKFLVSVVGVDSVKNVRKCFLLCIISPHDAENFCSWDPES